MSHQISCAAVSEDLVVALPQSVILISQEWLTTKAKWKIVALSVYDCWLLAHPSLPKTFKWLDSSWLTMLHMSL